MPIKNHQQRLRTFFADQAADGIVAVYLFGSNALGRAHRDSDVDVAVLLDRRRYPSARDRFEARVRLGSQLIDVLDHNEVDVVILNDVPPTFARRIVTEGQRLFCANLRIEHAFVRDVQLRAADLAPFLRRMRSIKLEALAR